MSSQFLPCRFHSWASVKQPTGQKSHCRYETKCTALKPAFVSSSDKCSLRISKTEATVHQAPPPQDKIFYKTDYNNRFSQTCHTYHLDIYESRSCGVRDRLTCIQPLAHSLQKSSCREKAQWRFGASMSSAKNNMQTDCQSVNH